MNVLVLSMNLNINVWFSAFNMRPGATSTSFIQCWRCGAMFKLRWFDSVKNYVIMLMVWIWLMLCERLTHTSWYKIFLYGQQRSWRKTLLAHKTNMCYLVKTNELMLPFIVPSLCVSNKLCLGYNNVHVHPRFNCYTQ